MCGIHFIWDKKNSLENNNFGLQIIQKMTLATTHRGQGIDNFCKKNNLYFGHNLLAISDFSPLAYQPFYLEDNILVFNGQIYNHLDIRKKTNNYAYKTHSDTETLAHFLENLPKNNPQNALQTLQNELNGMYALVHYDHANAQILVTRDKHGIKPLFLFENQNFLVISSEIKGILASGLVEKKINFDQIPHYLTFKYAQFPNTFFENIFEVKDNFVIDLKNQQKTYFSPIFSQKEPQQFTKTLISPPKILYDLDTLLKNAVKSQLLADRNVGVFASGGVDSTLLLAYCQELGYQTTAYSAVNSAEERHFGTEDYHFAKKSALQYGAKYEEMPLKSDILEDLQTYVSNLDQPIADGAGLLTYHLSKMASTTHQVLLSGAGADEIFAGYNRHQAFYFYEKYQLKYFYWLKNITNPIFNAIFFGNIFRKKIRLFHKIFNHIFWQKTPTFLGFTTLNIPLNTAFFFDFLEKEKPQINSLKNALTHDKNNFLRHDILAITDHTTMQNTLEMRVPYLDNKVVDFAHQFPANFLLKNGKKWLLKEILAQKNGKIYTQRPKEGFGMPIGLWLTQPQHAHYIDFLKNLPEMLYQYINKQAFNRNIDLHITQKLDYSAEMWAVLVLGLIVNEFKNS